MTGLGRSLGDILAGTGPTARMFDPDTAKQAGRKAAEPGRLSHNQRYVLDRLAVRHNHHQRGIVDDDGLTDFEYPGLQQTSAGKRRLELQRAGLVEDSGRRRPSPSGSPVIVWRITTTGLYVLRGFNDASAA
jgi:hypothetical protein